MTTKNKFKINTTANCPACYEARFRVVGCPVMPRYQKFPNGIMPMYETETHFKDRQLLECNSCGLRYYHQTPNLVSLTELYNIQSITEHWNRPGRNRHQYQKLLGSCVPFTEQDRISILDIGCDTGEFLKTVPKSWQKNGVEVNPKASYLAQKTLSEANIRTGVFEDIEFAPNSCDLITAWDVMEHIHDIKTFLNKVSLILKPGGFFVFETGNFSSNFARFANLAWWYYSLLEHTVFYDPRVVQTLLPAHGLDVKSIVGTTHNLGIKKSSSFRSRFVAILIVVYTWRGKISSVHSFMARLLHKAGTLAKPDFCDHMLVISQKTITDKGMN